MDIKQKSISGVFWTFIDIIINKGFYFVATIILARILGPEEFGLLGMIALFVNIGNALIDSGMSTSLLRATDLTEKDYSTVFVTNVIMSVIIYLILYFLAPYVANFYSQASLNSLIKWYCLGFIIGSFRSIHVVRLMKEMDFKKITILNLPGNILSAISSIWAGYAGYGFWSLIILFLVNQSVSTLMFWLFIEWKPYFLFDFNNYKKHFKFGYKLLISSQLNVFFENIYNILIGKFYGVGNLGYYERAYTFNSYPVSVLTGIILRVSLPTLAILKNDLVKLQYVYKRILQISFLVSGFGLLFSCIFAEKIILLVLGDNWLPVTPFFQILSISFIFYPIHSLNINILSVFGRSDLFLKLEIVKKVLIILIVASCFRFGIMGLLWSSVINSVINLIINTHFSGLYLNYSTKNQIFDILPSFLLIIISLSFVLPLNYIGSSLNPLFFLVVAFVISFFVLIMSCEFSKLSSYVFIKNQIIEYFKK